MKALLIIDGLEQEIDLSNFEISYNKYKDFDVVLMLTSTSFIDSEISSLPIVSLEKDSNQITSNSHRIEITEENRDGYSKLTDHYCVSGDIIYLNDKNELHRLNGPAIESVEGNKYWFENGKRHRLDGPAVRGIDGDKLWYRNGELHRLDGPAIEYENGNKFFYINGNKLTEEEFKKKNEVKVEAIGIAHPSKLGVSYEQLNKEGGNLDTTIILDDLIKQREGKKVELVDLNEIKGKYIQSTSINVITKYYSNPVDAVKELVSTEKVSVLENKLRIIKPPILECNDRFEYRLKEEFSIVRLIEIDLEEKEK